MTIAGNYYDYDTWGSLGWQSEYSWTTDGCSNSDSTFGGLSITCLLISLITNMILIYWMIKRKNTDKLSIGPCALEQRHILIIICSLMFLLLLASSSAYFSNCNEALWSASTSYESSYYVDWGPDYGLILAWVQCALLLDIVVVNVVAWTKEQTDAQVEINSNPKPDRMQWLLFLRHRPLCHTDGVNIQPQMAEYIIRITLIKEHNGCHRQKKQCLMGGVSV
eukprot:169259_1